MKLNDWVDKWAKDFTPKNSPAVLYDAFAAEWDKAYRDQLKRAKPSDREALQLQEVSLRDRAWQVVRANYAN